MKPWMWLALGGAAFWFYKNQTPASSGTPPLLDNTPVVTPTLQTILTTPLAGWRRR